MLEEIVEYDDAAMEKYLDGKTLTFDEIRLCIRKGVLSTKLFPVLCGTAFKNKCVKLLLDAIV